VGLHVLAEWSGLVDARVCADAPAATPTVESAAKLAAATVITTRRDRPRDQELCLAVPFMGRT
jgi:hypothetical protein